MKRPRSPATEKYVGTSGDIKKDLSQEQLAAIGAVAMAYNKAEEEIDHLFGIATKLDDRLLLAVSTRIHGIDGKIAIIKHAATIFGVAPDAIAALNDTLGGDGFVKLKGLRDAAVHARLINAAIGVGVRIDKRAQINEVLLSKAALDALYEHLIALANELKSAANILAFTLECSARKADDPERARYEQESQHHSAEFQSLRNRRQTLQPIPQFPSESEFRETDDEWKQARQAERQAIFLLLQRRRRRFQQQRHLR
jgi:hypothetical protein